MFLISLLKGLAAKPVVFFTASRYFSYALLFLRGLLVAKLLGPYFLGIWGFITLYQQYLSFTSLGIQFAVSTELALLEMNDHKRRNSLINSSFTLTLIIFCIVIALAFILQFYQIEIFKTEGSYRYIVLTFLIAVLQHFRELFSNIFRTFNDYWRIALGELLIALVTLIVVFFFKDENLIVALLLSWAISLALSIVIFVVNAPFKLRLFWEFKEVKGLLSIGLPLLLYTISYYLMTLSSRTIISIYYDLDIVGYYTFANNITNATLLGLNAASWVFYPTILSKLKESTDEVEIRNTINRVNSLYGVAVVLVVYLGIMFSPLLYVFLEKYKPAGTVLNILLLSQAILSLGFIFNTLAIARKKHNQIAIISLGSTLLSTVLCLIFASLKMDFEWLAISTLIGFTVYTIIICLYGLKILKIEGFSIRQFFPFNLQLSMFLFLVGGFSNYSLLFYFLGLSLFIWTNRGNLLDITNFIIKPQKSKQTPDVKC